MSDTISVIAGGTINPSVFIKLSDDNSVTQCSADTDNPIGVTAESTRDNPAIDTNSGAHAIAGDNVQYYPEGSECLLIAGASVTAGDFLASDANGYGRLAASGDVAAFQTYQDGSANDLVRGKVLTPRLLA